MNFFDILYGLRKWQTSKLQWLTLVIGFGMFIAIFGFALQLGEAVTAKVPSWVADKNFFYKTIGRRNVQGDFVTITGRQLESLQQVPNLESIAKLGFKRNEFAINDEQDEMFNVAYVDATFIKMTALSNLFQINQDNDDLVLVSEKIWQRLNENGQSPFWVSKPSRGLKYKVLGVIPASMKKIGILEPDLILMQSQLIHTLPVFIDAKKSAANARMAKSMINSFPIFYSIISSKEHIENSLIEQQLSKQLLNNSSIKFNEHKKDIWVISGVEFSPKLKSAINNQWILVLSLVVVFGFLNYFNLFNVAASRLVTRLDEFRVRLTVGAAKKDILKQVIIEQCPMIMAVLITGGLSYQLLVSFITRQPAYQQYFDSQFSINLTYWFTASFITICFIMLCACLPLMSLFKKSIFTRVDAKTGSKSSSIAIYSLVLVQLFCTLLVILLTVNMLMTSIKHRLSYSFPDEVAEFEIKFNPAANIEPDIDGQRLADAIGNTTLLSWAKTPFIYNNLTVSEIEINDNEPEQNIKVRLMFISKDYFESVQADVNIFNDAKVSDGLILNSTAMKLVKMSLGQNIINRELNVKHLMSSLSLPIIGEVNDLPHLGDENSHHPVIYVHFKHGSSNSSSRLYAYIDREKTSIFNTQVKLWLKSLGVKGEIKPMLSVKERLNIINHTQITLLNLSLLMTMLVTFLLCASFYYQSYLMLSRHQVRFGVMRAIGAKPIEIMKFVLFRYSILFLVAVLATIIFSLFNRELLEFLIKQKLDIYSSVFFSAVLTYLVLIVSIVTPTINFQRSSIMNLLRYRG